ncbi:hypothetical protein CP532_2584 [Ophiocordyceps camponoti-leonardi (nom. inval.)]|nr:hypothetical protein CP532_2584 [Ophiocordyceps camponoti-leonardi (nom. inval.)]
MRSTAFNILLLSFFSPASVRAQPGLLGSSGSYDLDKARQQQPPVEEVRRLPPPYTGPKPEPARPPPYFPPPDPHDLPPPTLGQPPRMEAGAERPPLYTPSGEEALPRKNVDRHAYPFYDQLPPHVSQDTRNRPPAWDRIYNTVPGDGRGSGNVVGQDSPPTGLAPGNGDSPFSRSGSAESVHESLSGASSSSGHDTAVLGQDGRAQLPSQNGNPLTEGPQSSSSSSRNSRPGGDSDWKRRLLKLPFCHGGRTGSYKLAKRRTESCIWPDDPRIVDETNKPGTSTGTDPDEALKKSKTKEVKGTLPKVEADGKKPGRTTTTTALQAKAKKPKHLMALAQMYSQREFANMARKAGHAAVVERRWGKTLSEVRTKALGYIGLSSKSSKSAAMRVQNTGLTAIGYVVWIEQMIVSFATETTRLDKAAAVTMIIPFVGCGVSTYAKTEKKGEFDAMVALDAGLCLLGDGLLLGGTTAPLGIVVHIVRYLIQLFEPPPSLPSLQDMMDMRDGPWDIFLHQHLTGFLSSKTWRDKLEGAIAIEALAIWSEAADVVGLIEASRQFVLNETVLDVQPLQKREEEEDEEEDEKPTTSHRRHADPEAAIVEVRNKAAAEVIRRQRQNLLSLPGLLRDSFDASIKKTAEHYNREFIQELNSREVITRYPSDAPIAAWTRGDALYEPARQYFEATAQYLWAKPPQLPSLFTLAYFVGVSAGVDDPPPARVVHGDMPGFAKYAAAEEEEWTSAVDAAVIDPVRYYREKTGGGDEGWDVLVRHTLAVARLLEGKIRESDLPRDAPPGLKDVREFHILLAMHIGSTFANWKEARGSDVGYIHEDFESDEAGLISRLYPITRLEAKRLISFASSTYLATPYSDPNANCRDALKLLAIAIGTEKTAAGGAVISLSVRPSTRTCPQIQGVEARPSDRGGYWPSCLYMLPPTKPKVKEWWSELVRSMPSAYSKIRRGGLDLEALKGCEGLREVFVSGKVTSVRTDENGLYALDLYGVGSISFGWCLDSRASAGSGRGQWYCTSSSLIDDLPAV